MFHNKKEKCHHRPLPSRLLVCCKRRPACVARDARHVPLHMNKSVSDLEPNFLFYLEPNGSIGTKRNSILFIITRNLLVRSYSFEIERQIKTGWKNSLLLWRAILKSWCGDLYLDYPGRKKKQFRLPSIGIKRDQLRVPLKPLGASQHYRIEGFNEGPQFPPNVPWDACGCVIFQFCFFRKVDLLFVQFILVQPVYV